MWPGGFPGDPAVNDLAIKPPPPSVVKNPPTNAQDPGTTPGPRKSHMLWGK